MGNSQMKSIYKNIWIGTVDRLQIKISKSSGVLSRDVIILQKFLIFVLKTAWSVYAENYFADSAAMMIMFQLHVIK